MWGGPYGGVGAEMKGRGDGGEVGCRRNWGGVEVGCRQNGGGGLKWGVDGMGGGLKSGVERTVG